MNVRYRISYLGDGQRIEHIVMASSAAAAVQLAHALATTNGATFELLSVLVVPASTGQ